MTEERRATTFRLSTATLEWLKVESLRARTSMTAFVEEMINNQRRGGLGQGIGGDVPCPVCGVPSYYARVSDRFVHEDGSANRDCWLAILRGDRPGDDRTPTELERAMRKART